MSRLQTIASSLPPKGCVLAARNAVSFSTVFIVAVLCLTSGTTAVFGHATACGNINNEKAFVNALYADTTLPSGKRTGGALRRTSPYQPIMTAITALTWRFSARAKVIGISSVRQAATLRSILERAATNQFRTLTVGDNSWLSSLQRCALNAFVGRVAITFRRHRMLRQQITLHLN
jgi:hypothetical protein